MVYGTRSSNNTDTDNIKERLQDNVCKLGFQQMTGTDIVNAAAKQKAEKEGGED
jgi:hypothetical protein